jgi:hypothetical protein
MPQEISSVSLDADGYIAHPEIIKEAVVVGVAAHNNKKRLGLQSSRFLAQIHCN